MTEQLIPVKFYEETLCTMEKDDQIWVVMKSVVNGMGLEWSGQQKKLKKQNEKFSCVHKYITGADGKNYQMLCMPIKKINGWLFSINPAKLRPEIRDKVIRYQEECFLALYDYWHKGAAVNPRTATGAGTIDIIRLCAQFEKALKLAKRAGLLGDRAIYAANRAVLAATGIDALTWINPDHRNAPYHMERSAQRFMGEQCIACGDAIIPRQEFFDAYKKWCRKNNLVSCGRTKFYRAVHASGYVFTKRRETGDVSRSRRDCFVGIVLKDNDSTLKVVK